MRAYAPQVILKRGEFWVAEKGLKQKHENKMRPKVYKSSQVQKEMPYLIKKKFVPLESEQNKFARYAHEDEPDTMLRNFK